MKKKAIIIFIGIILICSITLFLSAFFSGKDSDKLQELQRMDRQMIEISILKRRRNRKQSGRMQAALHRRNRRKEVQKIHQQIPRWIWERNNRQRTLIMR